MEEVLAQKEHKNFSNKVAPLERTVNQPLVLVGSQAELSNREVDDSTGIGL